VTVQKQSRSDLSVFCAGLGFLSPSGPSQAGGGEEGRQQQHVGEGAQLRSVRLDTPEVVAQMLPSTVASGTSPLHSPHITLLYHQPGFIRVYHGSDICLAFYFWVPSNSAGVVPALAAWCLANLNH